MGRHQVQGQAVRRAAPDGHHLHRLQQGGFATAGITSVPDALADAWTWDEFATVATKLRSSLPAKKFPFAYDWTQAGAFRWLSWHYQAGGTAARPRS